MVLAEHAGSVGFQNHVIIKYFRIYLLLLIHFFFFMLNKKGFFLELNYKLSVTTSNKHLLLMF